MMIWSGPTGPEAPTDPSRISAASLGVRPPQTRPRDLDEDKADTLSHLGSGSLHDALGRVRAALPRPTRGRSLLSHDGERI